MCYLRLIICLLACYLIPVTAKLQTVIRGNITDSAGHPVAQATVSLFKEPKKQSPIRRTIAEKDGRFQFLKIDTGRYIILISAMGFADRRMNLTAASAENDLGAITIRQTPMTLQNVTVTAIKPMIEVNDDRIAYNVEQDPAAKSETAIEILRKTPFVSVDADGNIQVNGQSNFKILLNGRETAMFAQNTKQALQGFPGVSITRIEVITSPSAKYDAEGIGGIINIITAKKMKGYNGTLYTGYSSLGFLNSNLNFSLKTGKVGFVVNYSYGWNGKGLDVDQYLVTTPNQPSAFQRRITSGARKHTFFFNSGNAEFTYDLDSFAVVSLFSNVSGGWNRTEVDQIFRTEFSGSATESDFLMTNRGETPNYTVGLELIKKYRRSKEEELSFRLYQDINDNNTFYSSIQDNPGTDRFVINNSESRSKQYTLQGDYVKPLTPKSRLEAGGKFVVRDAVSDFQGFIKYDPMAQYKVNTGNTDYLSYRQKVYSAYAMYQFKTKNITWRAGLRAEQTEVDGNFKTTATSIDQRYLNIFPNLQASFPMSKKVSGVVNYSQRIQRPFIWHLNPFVNDTDSLNISYGNPGLEPQIFHSLNFQTRFAAGKVFIALTTTASYSDDKIVSYTSFNPTSGVSTTTSDNLGKEAQLTISANVSSPISKKIRLSMNGLAVYGSIKNAKDNRQSYRGSGYRCFTSIAYTVSSKMTLSSNLSYNKQPMTYQTSYTGYGTYTFSSSFKVFKEKLNLNFAVENFFRHKFRNSWITKDPLFTTRSDFENPYRLVRISFNYNFGKLKENVSKKKGVANDDLITN